MDDHLNILEVLSLRLTEISLVPSTMMIRDKIMLIDWQIAVGTLFSSIKSKTIKVMI